MGVGYDKKAYQNRSICHFAVRNEVSSVGAPFVLSYLFLNDRESSEECQDLRLRSEIFEYVLRQLKRFVQSRARFDLGLV